MVNKKYNQNQGTNYKLSYKNWSVSILFFLFRASITVILLHITSNLSGQNLKTLQLEIRRTEISDIKKIRRIADKIYKRDPYNEVATFALVLSFNRTNNEDSIPKLFEHLKSIDPKNPRPYLMSAFYQFPVISIADTLGLRDLKIAVKLDTNSFEAHYDLGSSYYTLFNKSQSEYYAFQSRDQLVKATQIKPSSIDFLKYPIIQLSYFLKDSFFFSGLEPKLTIPTTKNSSSSTKKKRYFPPHCFLELSNNWQNNYSTNLIHEIEKASFDIERYSRNLQALKEPLMYNQTNKTIYRFTWLRTFHKPIAIRLEKTNKSYKLYWKQTSGRAGFDPGKLTVRRSIKISANQWDTFISLLNTANFWKMDTKLKNDLGVDGSEWIIEGIENGKYHVVNRHSPKNNSFQKCGQYLIELTNLKASRKKIY